MSSIGLNRRIHKFIDGKQREMPELRDKDVDELLRDFAKEGRSSLVF
jgi:replicative superfamily II helicase